LGGPGDSEALGVTADNKGSIYVTGSSEGLDGILVGSPGQAVVFQGNFAIGLTALTPGLAYVLKLNGTTFSRTYLKYMGSGYAEGGAIAINSSGRAWVTGNSADSEKFPSVHPFQAETGNGFISQISGDGSGILFSSLTDFSPDFVLDGTGNVFLAATRNLPDQPIAQQQRSSATSVIQIINRILISPLQTAAEFLRIDAAVPGVLTVEKPLQIGTHADSPGGVTGGEVLILTGTGLGPDQQVLAQVGPDGKLPTSVAGTSVTFDGVSAPLLSVQSERIECIVPFTVQYGLFVTTLMSVERNGSFSNSIRLGVVRDAIELLGVVNADGSSNTQGQPAPPGSVISLFVSGAGPTDPQSVDGQPNGAGVFTSPLYLQIDDQNMESLYAGTAAGEVAGIGQFNIQVPSLAPGPHTLSVHDYFSSDSASVSLYIGHP
jgi:uncharacterized protein (TIGR03437 family)